jgi:Cft2 family RNA processing exonuclease
MLHNTAAQYGIETGGVPVAYWPAMKLYFLGGADEVGASCLLVEAAGRRILVDAGIRMGSAATDRLPDLARASDLGGLDAILVTHAHLDHTGALPLVHGAFPRADILMTAPTLGLLRILLLDALKIMELKSDQEGEIPLYPLPAVESLLARAVGKAFLEPFPLGDGAIRATFFPAGHVLGAAAVGLETPEGNVLVTGDVSVTDQLTVPGMPRPRFSPDVMVCEATYGARLHASRRAEEERLAQNVLDVLRGGGKVLIPAFALGRAQEVLLILRKALARPDAPPAIVYCDGMVRAICGVYSQYSDALSRTLRERAQAGRGLFYTADGRIRPVQSPAEREEILRGDPCVIVSSSGMLSGGPSQFYAAGLASSESSLISITGYQDEEAPGRRLQELAASTRTSVSASASESASRELMLGGRRVPVHCAVGTYTLSAHADAQELVGLVQSLAPRDLFLVHGDPQARQGLAGKLFDAGFRSVHLPAVGDEIALDAAPRRPGRRSAPMPGSGPVSGSGPGSVPAPGIGAARPFDSEALPELHRHLWATEPQRRTYSIADLASHWYGSAAHGSVAPGPDLTAVHEVLRADQTFFEPDARRPFLYRCVDPARPASAPAGSRDEHGRLEQNAALARVHALLGPDTGSGLYKKGADRETWSLRLAFDFPDADTPRAAEAIATLEKETGWAVVVNPEPRQAALEQLAVELLPPQLKPSHTHVTSASIYKEERRVTIPVPIPVPEPPPPDLAEELSAMCEQFESRTGYELQLEHTGAAAQTPAAKQLYDDTGRMEINHAFALIDRTFTDQPHRPSKKSKKSDPEGPLIELSFISPEVGARHQELIDDLAYRTSWRLRIASKVDQQAVLQLVRTHLPTAWQVTKGPGLDVANRRVILRLATPPPPDDEDLAALAATLDREAGFSMKIS